MALDNYPISLSTFFPNPYDEAQWRRQVNTQTWSSNVVTTVEAKDGGQDAVFTVFDGPLTGPEQAILEGLATSFPPQSGYTQAVVKKAGDRRPNRNDDITYGAQIDDLWHDARIQRTYICDSNDVGSAKWRRLGSNWVVREQPGNSFPADTDGVMPAYMDGSGDWQPVDATALSDNQTADAIVVKTDGDFLWISLDACEVYAEAHSLVVGAWYTISNGGVLAVVRESLEPLGHLWRQRVCLALTANTLLVRLEARHTAII